MPVKAYDAEGNEIGEIPTAEELAALNEKAGQVEELQQKLESNNPKSMREAIERRDARIEKLKAALGPDAKFDEDGSPIVGDKVTPDTVKEAAKSVVEEQFAARAAQEVAEYEESLLTQYSDSNEDVSKAIKAEFDELKGDRTLSKSQVEKFMRLASQTVLGAGAAPKSPASKAFGQQRSVGGGVDRTNKNRVSRGVEVAKGLGIRLNNAEDLTK